MMSELSGLDGETIPVSMEFPNGTHSMLNVTSTPKHEMEGVADDIIMFRYVHGELSSVFTADIGIKLTSSVGIEIQLTSPSEIAFRWVSMKTS
jgi:hypothetical protein